MTIEYSLADGVFLVQGVKRGAIYDTRTGNVYSINASAAQIILGETQHEAYWLKLLEMGLVVRMSGAKRDPRLSVVKTDKLIDLNFVWFEIVSDDCNLHCRQCYAGSMPPVYRRVETLARKKLTYQMWCQLIKEGFRLGCSRCQFIGGEPFLYCGENQEDVLDLARHAREVGYEKIEIFTNATLLTAKRVQRIKELGLKMAVTLYSVNATVHDSVTQTPGSHRLTMRGLQLLKKAKVPTRVETVVMRHNQDTIEETMAWVEEMGFRHKKPDPLRPVGRGSDNTLQPSAEILAKYGLMTQPNFRADLERVKRYVGGHSCLAGKITITDNGDVLPCIFSRSQVVGSVSEGQPLLKIVEDEPLQRIWHSTKDDVLVCRDCEYRYVCFDCRPLAGGVTLGQVDYLHAPPPRCSYDPHIGEWETYRGKKEID